MSVEIINAFDVENTYETPEEYFKIGEKEIKNDKERINRPKRSFFSSRYGLDIMMEETI